MLKTKTGAVCGKKYVERTEADSGIKEYFLIPVLRSTDVIIV